MKKDKLTYIEEKIIEKEIEKKTHIGESQFPKNAAATDPFKSISAKFAKFRLDKKKIKPDDLI